MKNRNQKKSKRGDYIFYFLIFVLSLYSIFYILTPSFVWAASASLYLSPSSGNYTVGNTFSVQVKVNTGGLAINAADGTLVFDANDLEVRTVSKEDSIFSLWVQDPIFSNSLGTINFAGGKPSPGYSGSAGVIFTIIFKGKTAGAANISFASGSILADDGKGTNILANMGSAVFNLTGREISPIPPLETEKPAAEQEQTTKTATAAISSPTHPEEKKWYSNNSPEFQWSLLSGVNGVSLLLNQKPTSDPGSVSDGQLKSKKYENIADGVWYFHIKFRSQQGWGKITHRKVLIDTKPPSFFAIKAEREDLTDPQPILRFKTDDETSGLEYYEVKTGQKDPFRLTLQDVQSNPYKLQVLAPGKHSIEVKAFDKAGNYTSSFADIEILPLEQPTIAKFPKRLGLDQNLTLEGKSFSEATIKVFIQQKGKKPATEEILADEQGSWSFVSKGPLEKGNYDAWVQAQDERGALSLPSSKINFEVGLPPFLKFGKIAIDYLTTVITLIVLIFVLLLVLAYSWYRVSFWRKRIRTEAKEVSQAVRNAFKALREEVQEQIEYLDKKPGLTNGEKKIRDKLKESLDVSEEFISKEIKDVEKELE